MVEIAAGEMRALGPGGVGVARIMRLAGLTHGGFYAHFRSKDDLVAAAIAHMFEDAARRVEAQIDGKPKAVALRDYVRAYVSREHRDAPRTGCPVAALASEIHRLGRKSRQAFDRGMSGVIDRLASLIGTSRGQPARAAAMSMLAEMTGAVAAARAVAEPRLSDDILANVRDSLLERIPRA